MHPQSWCKRPWVNQSCTGYLRQKLVLLAFFRDADIFIVGDWGGMQRQRLYPSYEGSKEYTLCPVQQTAGNQHVSYSKLLHQIGVRVVPWDYCGRPQRILPWPEADWVSCIISRNDNIRFFRLKIIFVYSGKTWSKRIIIYYSADKAILKCALWTLKH